MEDLSLTQINAYVLEYVRAQKAEAQAVKNSRANSRTVNANTPLNSLAGLGIKLKVKK